MGEGGKLPLRKGGGGTEKGLANQKGGAKSVEVDFTQELDTLAILIGGGGQKVSTI